MGKRYDKDSLGVELPRFHTSYAKREQILNNVLTRKKAAWPGWFKPALTLSAAAALILLLILPQLAPDFGRETSPGVLEFTLAADWDRATGEYPDLSQAQLTFFEGEMTNKTLRYRMRVMAQAGTELVEVTLTRNGGNLKLQRTKAASPAPGYPIEILKTLDRYSFGKLAPDNPNIQATLTMRAPGIPDHGGYWGREWSLLRDNGTLLSLDNYFLELSGESLMLVLTVQGQREEQGFVLPLGSWNVYDTTAIRGFMTNKGYGYYKITAIERFEQGWRVEADAGLERVVLTFATPDFVNPSLHFGRSFSSESLREYLLAYDIEILSIEPGDKAWIVSGRYRLNEGAIHFSNADGAVLYRTLSLARTIPGTKYYVTSNSLSHLGEPVLYTIDGIVTGAAAVGDGVVLEVQKGGSYEIYLPLKGRVLALGANIRLNQVGVAPDFGEALWSDGRWQGGGRLELKAQYLSQAWSPDSRRVAVATEGGIFLVSRGARSPQRQLTQVPASNLVWLDNSHLAWAEGGEAVIWNVDSMTGRAFNFGGRLRLVAHGSELIIGVAGEDRASAHTYTLEDGFQVLMPDTEIKSSEAFLESLAYSGRFLSYRPSEDRSKLKIWSQEHMNVVTIRSGLAAPIWLTQTQLALVGPDGVQYLQAEQYFR